MVECTEGGDDGEQKIPQGDLCLKCGCTMKLFPKMEPHEVISSLAGDTNDSRSFRKEFFRLREVVKTIYRTIADQAVTKQTHCGIRLSVRVGCVPLSVFNAYRKLPVEALRTAKQGRIMTPDMTKLDVAITCMGGSMIRRAAPEQSARHRRCHHQTWQTWTRHLFQSVPMRWFYHILFVRQLVT